MSNKKTDVHEVAQPLSQGEKSFKGYHNPVKHNKLVPGVTDQEHVFKGSTKEYDNKYPNSYKPGEDVKAYDKKVRADDATNSAGYEKAPVGEGLVDRAVSGAVQGMGNVFTRAVAKNLVSPRSRKVRAPAKIIKSHYESPGEMFKEALRAQAAEIKNLFLTKTTTNEEVEAVEEEDTFAKDNHELFANDYKNKSAKSDKHVKDFVQKAKRVSEEAEEVTEDYDDYDYEGEMAKAELRAICAKASAMADMMSDDQQLEAWLQSKISRAKDQIDAVHDYLMYSNKGVNTTSTATSAPVPAASVQAPMGQNYASFLNRMGEEVEQIEEMPSPRAMNKGARGRNIDAVSRNSKLKGMKSYRLPGQLSKKDQSAETKLLPGYKEALAKRGLKEAEEITDEELNEVLNKKSSAAEWIHDFVHSDNPKFAGKSTKMRQKMALAAYYAKQNEEVEQVDEKSLAALAPPEDEVTKKDILFGRGVLKQHPQDPTKHVLTKAKDKLKEAVSAKLGKNVVHDMDTGAHINKPIATNPKDMGPSYHPDKKKPAPTSKGDIRGGSIGGFKPRNSDLRNPNVKY